MFKKASLKSIDTWTKGKYILYQNNKFAIVKHYNKYGRQNYLRDIGQCFYMLICGIISIVGFPFVLIYDLYSFIPKIYIKDKSIDKEETENQEETDYAELLK